MRVPTLLAALGLFAYLLLRSGSASACMNGALEDMDTTVATLKAAEKALDQQDYSRASALASEVLPQTTSELHARALRIVALSDLRRPDGDPRSRRDARATLQRLLARSPADGTLEIDVAEAEARFPDTEDHARETLARNAKADLIGSPYAYAALAQLEAKAGHDAEAALATQRCTTMAWQPSICTGALPRPALLRGEPRTYGVVAAIFALALGLGALRARRLRPIAALGLTRRAIPTSMIVLVPAAVAATLLAHRPAVAIAIALSSLVVDRLVARRRLAAAIVGLPGAELRPFSPDSELDRGLFGVSAWPFGGPAPVVVERVPYEPAYREGARTALFLFGRAPRTGAPRSPALVLALAGGVALFVLATGLAALFLFTARSSATAHTSAASPELVEKNGVSGIPAPLPPELTPRDPAPAPLPRALGAR